jgi:DNA-binding MarR family transcriptional regulator
VANGQQLLPLIDHLARVGRRAADTCGTSCLRPRHLIALKLLGEHDSLTQHALGAALSLDPSNVVGLLNELEERDLITRRRDPADRRRHIVELSDSGSAELARAYREFGVVEDDLFKMLTAEERATLYTLLSRAVAALAPSCETAACAAGQAELSFPGPSNLGAGSASCCYPQAEGLRRGCGIGMHPLGCPVIPYPRPPHASCCYPKSKTTGRGGARPGGTWSCGAMSLAGFPGFLVWGRPSG